MLCRQREQFLAALADRRPFIRAYTRITSQDFWVEPAANSRAETLSGEEALVTRRDCAAKKSREGGGGLQAAGGRRQQTFQERKSWGAYCF